MQHSSLCIKVSMLDQITGVFVGNISFEKACGAQVVKCKSLITEDCMYPFRWQCGVRNDINCQKTLHPMIYIRVCSDCAVLVVNLCDSFIRIHQGQILLMWFNLISNHIHYRVWDPITYSFPDFKVWEWINNFISHVTGHVSTYPWWDQS